MGRAKGQHDPFAEAGVLDVQSDSVAAETLRLSYETRSGVDGELVELPSGAMVSLEDGDPDQIVRGLARVTSVSLVRPGVYKVLFTGNFEALVDLESNSVAINSDSDSLRQAALHAALAARAAQYPQSADSAQREQYGPLGEAYTEWLDSPNDPEAFRRYALAAAALGQEVLDEEVALNPIELSAELQGVELEPEDSAVMEDIMLGSLQEDLASAAEGAAEGAEKGDPVDALMYAVDANGEVQRPEDLFESAAALAEEHDLQIPELEIDLKNQGTPDEESVGSFYCGPEEKAVITQIRIGVEAGSRSFRIKGPAAAGKGSMVRQIAALRRSPLLVIDVSSETDPTDLFVQKEIVSKTQVAKLDENGNEVLDKDGNLVMEDIPALAVTEDVATVMAKAAQEGPLVVEFAELQNMRNMEALHSLFDQNVADPHNRRIVINGEVIRIHPECMFFATYNTGKEDFELEPATASRFSAVVMDAPNPDVHAKRVAAEVTAALIRDGQGKLGPMKTYGSLSNIKEEPKLDKNGKELKDESGNTVMRTELENPISPKQVEVVVKVCNLLATAAKTPGAGKVRHEISPRLYPQMVLHLMKYGYMNHKSPVDATLRVCRDILVSPEARSKAHGNLADMDEEIREMTREYRMPLEELAAIGRSRREEDEKAKKPAAKKTAKKSSTKKGE